MYIPRRFSWTPHIDSIVYLKSSDTAIETERWMEIKRDTLVLEQGLTSNKYSSSLFLKPFLLCHLFFCRILCFRNSVSILTSCWTPRILNNQDSDGHISASHETTSKTRWRQLARHVSDSYQNHPDPGLLPQAGLQSWKH